MEIYSFIYERHREKIYLMTRALVKTQISLHIRAVWSVIAVHTLYSQWRPIQVHREN